MKKTIITALAVSFLVGCSDAVLDRNFTYGVSFRVTLWSGGQPVKTYISTGRVETEEGSDGWFFKDKQTGGFVRVSGTVTVEEIVGESK